jgi:hypothetical protein
MSRCEIMCLFLAWPPPSGAGDPARRVGNHADARAARTTRGPSAGKSAGAAGGIARATECRYV